MDTFIPAWIGGRLTPVEKIEAHRLGLRHKAVSVFVVAGDEVLVQKRAAGKYHTPGLWANTCCTHPDWDEPARDCAVRRLTEELGITGLAPEFRQQVEYRAEVGNGLIEHEVVDIFRADAPRGLKIVPNPDEVAEVRWITLGRLRNDIVSVPERFTPWLRIYLDRHAEGIFGVAAAGA
jgi:isopentenyl-diphosphate delta-isomerase